MSRDRRPLPKGVPRTLRYQSVAFDVLALSDGRLAFAFYDGSRRVVVKRQTIDELRAEAERIGNIILNAETAALDVTAEDRRIYIAARDALRPLGFQVDAIARDVAAAHAIAPGISIRDLAHFFKRNQLAALVSKTVNEVIAAMCGEKEEQNLSSRWVRDVKNDSKWIARQVGERIIGEVTSDELLELFRALQKTRGFGWKRRNHLRDMAVTIWRYAQSKTWLASDRLTAAEVVPRLEDPLPYRVHATYSPNEMRAFLANIREEYRPWLIVCGFGPVRSEEVAPDPLSKKDPLRYEDFNWKTRLGTVRPETAKVRGEDRIFKISDQLYAWAEAEGWFTRTGPVCPGVQPSKRETARLARLSGAEVDGQWVKVSWKRNALRKTFISAMLGLVDTDGRKLHSRAQVAEMCGTSEKQIKHTYKRTLDPDQSSAWFSIMPANRPANVIQATLFKRL